jgi:hypothetical protein
MKLFRSKVERSDVKKKISRIRRLYHIIVSGLPVNDYDVYIQDRCSDCDWLSIITQEQLPQVLIKAVLDGRKRETILTIQSFLKLTITNLKKQFATKHLN